MNVKQPDVATVTSLVWRQLPPLLAFGIIADLPLVSAVHIGPARDDICTCRANAHAGCTIIARSKFDAG